MKLCLAPMATLSHEALRRTVARFGGCDEYYTEMIHAASLLHGGQFEKYYVMNGPEPEKIVWQLTGTDAASLAGAAAQVAALGGIGVDVNMGCSAPEIVRYGAGIAWMLKPVEETREMLAGVRRAIEDAAGAAAKAGAAPAKPEASSAGISAVGAANIDLAAGVPAAGGAPKADAAGEPPAGAAPLRLSVKIRLGDEDFTEESLFRFTDMLLEEGVKQIVLHPRTRKEKYSRPPRLQYLNSFCQYVKAHAPDVLVVGNGAVSDAGSLFRMLKAAPGLDGVMVARAAVQKPWIFAQLQAALLADEAASCVGGAPGSQPASCVGGAPGSQAASCVGGAPGSQPASCVGGAPGSQAASCVGGACSGGATSPGNTRAAPATIDLLDVAAQFTADLQAYQPAEFYDTRSRRFFSYYCDNFLYGHYVKAKVAGAKGRDEQLAALKEYFSKMPAEQFRTI